ncbi:MAG: cytochrome c oxidase assembly protein [Gammaproteobacteria bacterium]|jgi:putative membrane protein
MSQMLTWITPWEFSPTVLLSCLLAGALYLRGLQRTTAPDAPVSRWRTTSFFVGLVLIYLVLQSYFDFLSQHMFWVHRLQHLVLHHLGPFLVMIAMPGEVMERGLPGWSRRPVLALLRNRAVRIMYRILQNPLIASVLFVGLIYLWLTPGIHFVAMLSAPLYKVMNWSMVLDGLLFWWLIVDPRSPGEHRTPRYPVRILMLWGVMLPQIVLGAYIALSRHELYDAYSVCGRAWPISPLTDQEYGGLITWIPSAMMSVVGGLVVLRLWTRSGGRVRTRRAGVAAVEQA